MVRESCERERIAQKDYRFTRKRVRDESGWGNTQLKVHLDRLSDMEYLIAHGGGRGRIIEYELIYDGEGQDDAPFLMGLIDVESLKKHGLNAKKSGVEGKKPGSKRPQNGPKTGLDRGEKNAEKPINISANSDPPKSTFGKTNNASHHSPALAADSRPSTGQEI
jgi:hypothetical protein